MLNRCVPFSLRQSIHLIATRQLTLSAAHYAPAQQQATDPIQQLFIQKIREYNEKRKFVLSKQKNNSFRLLSIQI